MIYLYVLLKESFKVCYKGIISHYNAISLFYILLFALAVEDFRNGGALDLHCTLGAQLLTAEATNAIGAVYNRFFVFDFYSLGRTNIGADTATDTHLLDKHGLRTQYSACEFRKASLDRILSVACKEHRFALYNVLKIRENKL